MTTRRADFSRVTREPPLWTLARRSSTAAAARRVRSAAAEELSHVSVLTERLARFPGESPRLSFVDFSQTGTIARGCDARTFQCGLRTRCTALMDPREALEHRSSSTPDSECCCCRLLPCLPSASRGSLGGSDARTQLVQVVLNMARPFGPSRGARAPQPQHAESGVLLLNPLSRGSLRAYRAPREAPRAGVRASTRTAPVPHR